MSIFDTFIFFPVVLSCSKPDRENKLIGERDVWFSGLCPTGTRVSVYQQAAR